MLHRHVPRQEVKEKAAAENAARCAATEVRPTKQAKHGLPKGSLAGMDLPNPAGNSGLAASLAPPGEIAETNATLDVAMKPKSRIGISMSWKNLIRMTLFSKTSMALGRWKRKLALM